MAVTRAARDVPPRQDNVYLHDLRRNNDTFIMKITDLERFRDRIIECIDQGFLYDVRVIHYFIISNIFIRKKIYFLYLKRHNVTHSFDNILTVERRTHRTGQMYRYRYLR